MRAGFALLLMSALLVGCFATPDMDQALIGIDQELPTQPSAKPADDNQPKFDRPIFFFPDDPAKELEIYEKPIIAEPKDGKFPIRNRVEQVPYFHQRPHQ